MSVLGLALGLGFAGGKAGNGSIVNTVPPSLSGISSPPRAGETAVCDPGEYSPAADTIEYQWLLSADGGVNWTDIEGETTDSYPIQPEDQANHIACRVTASNTDGSVETRADGSGAIIAAPTYVSGGTISGSLIVGQTLQMDGIVWTDSPTSLTYQWSRWDIDGNSFVANIGTDSSAYTLQPDDRGYGIKCDVSATNSVGTSPAQSFDTFGGGKVGMRPENVEAPVAFSNGGGFTGDTLSTTSGVWLAYPDDPGLFFEWLKDSTVVSTGEEYDTNAGGPGNYRSRITATNSYGSGTPALSNVIVISDP